MSRLGAGGAQMGRGIGQLAGGLVRIGTVAAAAAITAAGAAAKVAISFEDAFANVEKTVEGTPRQLGAIDKALRTLSTTIPVTFQGLTTIAAEAGALGVATKDIVKFTEAVARTSAATVGLDPFMASEAFGKLSTIFGLTGDRVDAVTGRIVSDYERLGSTLVALGNAGASSEADIIAVTKRFAAAGQIAGLSAAQVLGWSSALASLGPEAEAAGGALQRVFNRAGRNIGLMDVGGLVGANARNRVKTFARVTGMTVDEFVALYTKDASAAMQRFIQGLQGMDQFQSAKALFEAGVINQRDILAIQGFSQRYEVLNAQLGIAVKAWEEHNELLDVSEKRFQTLAKQATMFGNTIKIGAAAVGDGMLPALTRLVAKAREFVTLHLDDLGKLGRDIGAGIDEIDWRQVSEGANAFVGILRTGFDLVKKIPPQVALMTAGFLGLNKISGGLLGAGIGNIVGGLGKSIANVLLVGLSRVPVVGGAIGALTAQRVYVVGGHLDGFGGGLPPGLLPAGAAAGVASAASIFLPLLAVGAVVTAIGMLVARVAHEANPDQFVDPTAQTGALGGGLPGAGNLRPFNRFGQPTVPAIANAVVNAINASGSPDDRSERLLTTIARNTSGSPDERDERHLAAIVSNTALAATRLGIIAGIRVPGKVPSVSKLHEIGSAEDPYGFKHLKAFALGKIPLETMAPELEEHIADVQRAIDAASAKGDTKTVDKLRETKAGLESLLRDVKAGTFHAGERAYEGALLVAAAINALPAKMPRLSPTPIAPNSSGSPDDRDTTSTPPHIGLGGQARGNVGLAKMPYSAMFGEAGDEGVAIIRNPRKWDGGGGVQVDIRPAPVRIFMDSRAVGYGLLMQNALTRSRLV